MDTDRKNLGTMEELMEGGSPEKNTKKPRAFFTVSFQLILTVVQKK